MTIEPNVVFGAGVTGGAQRGDPRVQPSGGCSIGPDCVVGPFARLRPGACWTRDVHVGNFVEVKASHLGAGVKANHLTYIGDASVGAGTNIGAGTITCNYDGYATSTARRSARDVFVGSDAALVAPGDAWATARSSPPAA